MALALSRDQGDARKSDTNIPVSFAVPMKALQGDCTAGSLFRRFADESQM
jgi:hypothetical protein